MDMTPVESSAVSAVGYDPESRTLRVAFRSGGVYDYLDVDPDLYARMLRPHAWRRVGRWVVRHRFRKV